MATLWVNGETGPLLREWLQGDWAMLFSHPIDFQYQGLETDRWLSILREEFCAREVRPLACRRSLSDLDASWASDLVEDHSLLRLGGTDVVARRLREDLSGLATRFVVIVDESLQRRGVLKYSAGRNSVSPLDLLASIDMLRRRSPARIAA
jgi:alkyl hydroperoxide reductase subunit AhpC